ncbi:MAG TPA: hypothetical protein VNR87_06135 [Flavisolibacter sp.]|nr:hypothetical protein [Flavisolibacter sp.]
MTKLLLLTPLIFFGCKKSDPPIRSSEKSIASAIFRTSDNPVLSFDIAGAITADSIKFSFPPYIAVNALVPLIEFSGKTIKPANKTPQDFTNGVSYQVTAEDGSMHNYFFAITRMASDTSTMVLGSWKLIKDSVSNNNWVNPSGGYPLPGVYIGAPGDFWKFEPNGVFSARENNITGSDTYNITANNKLVIPVWSNQYGPATIETLNNASFIVYFSATSANGGQYLRKVYLQR